MEIVSKVFFMINDYIMPTLLVHLQQTAKIQSCYRKKKLQWCQYSDYFFNIDFMLLFLTKKKPKAQSLRLNIREKPN